MAKSKQPQPPKHLSVEARKWWRSVVEDYALESHHLKLLRAACEAWDAAQKAREQLAKDGPIIVDRFGQQKGHPAAVIQRDMLGLFARLTRELGLDADGPSEAPRTYTRPTNANLRIREVG